MDLTGPETAVQATAEELIAAAAGTRENNTGWVL